ncbi:MAG: chromate transporter [Armatimonadota bacterium]
MTLRTLATRFLRVGAMGFGGPMALIGLIHEQVVEKHQDVSEEEFSTGVALGQILPGPVAVDCATHIGHHLRGWAGASVAAGAMLLPAFLLMLVLTPLYLKYGRIPQVSGFFQGVAPAIIAVILMAGYNMAQKFKFTLGGVLIAVAAGVGMILKVNPVLLILLAGFAGIALRSRCRTEGNDAA